MEVLSVVMEMKAEVFYKLTSLLLKCRVLA